MTTATAAPTWPTTAELNRVSKLIAEAQNALDELQLKCYQLDNDSPTPVPTLEELGDLSRFIAWTVQDIEVIQGHLEGVQSAHHAGAVSMATDDAS